MFLIYWLTKSLLFEILFDDIIFSLFIFYRMIFVTHDSSDVFFVLLVILSSAIFYYIYRKDIIGGK